MPSRTLDLVRKSPYFLVKMLSYIVNLLTSLLSWRALLGIYILLNLKNIPLAWEIRLFYRGYCAWQNKKSVARKLREAHTKQQQQLSNKQSTNSDEKEIQTNNIGTPTLPHPLFQSTTITSHTPLLETDHNLHKSNSTYFSDLDESRTALVVSLLSPTNFSPSELEREGYKGSFSVVLGSVHTTFLKEIKPYTTYKVRTRVLGWDRKWIVMGSWFVRPDAKRGEVLLACCLSKYVVKKGRFTVPPERCFRSAGWLPDAPVEPQPEPNTQGSESTLSRVVDTVVDKSQQTIASMAKTDDKFKLHISDEAKLWKWEDIEAERSRGIAVARKWLDLDSDLKDEYAREMSV